MARKTRKTNYVRSIATIVLIVALWQGAYGVAFLACIVSGLIGAVAGGLEFMAKHKAESTKAEAARIRAEAALVRAQATLAKAEAAKASQGA